GPQERVSESVGSIKGSVKEKSGDPLVGASVLIKGTKVGCATDVNGHYTIPKLKPGSYTLDVSFVGCASTSRAVVVRAGEATVADFSLEPSSFMIGAIECVGETELLPKEAQTKTVITGAEIEHYQASSVGDVLDLVPGIQKSANPGIARSSLAAVRGNNVTGNQADYLGEFGTLVVVDGIPMSNNANLQFEKVTTSTTGSGNLGRSADLRMIPADNIQTIEVVSGIPSVRYGDVTSGIINVQTKIGRQPHRLKIKTNPDTREANLGGGFGLGESGISYNLNVAQSERNVRLEGDEFSRLTGQLVLSNTLFENQLTMNNKVLVQRIFDEEAPKDDVFRTRNYNRGYTLTYGLWGKYVPLESVSNLEYNTYVTYRRENSMKSKLVQSDLRILPTGDTISTYTGKVETRGAEWTIGGRLEWNTLFYTGDLIHRLTVGSDVQYNANTGEGLLIDSLYNYYGSTSGRRSYAFDEIPGQTLLSFYAEDRFTGQLGVDFSLSIGARYETYRPFAFNIKGLWGDGDLVRSHQGSFFNPRLNLLVYLTDENQIRLSAGLSSKSPSMSSIYPAPDVLQWRNQATTQTLYFHPDRRAPGLKGYREGQVEVGYDHKLFDVVGASVSAYYKKRSNEPIESSYPVFTTMSEAGITKAYFVDTYTRYGNSGSTESKGIELSLRTVQIKPLNMQMQITGSYTFSKRKKNAYEFAEAADTSIGRYATYRVVQGPVDTLIGFLYPRAGGWDERLILNYYLKYTLPPLGLWMTLRAEYTLLENYQELDLKPLDYAKLTPTGQMQRDFDAAVSRKPVKWLFNLNISKSLFAGAEVSFYVNNFLDEPAIWRHYSSLTQTSETIRNPDLFYGIEFSMSIDHLLK
ncbi:MAG: TonB-dependent receptor, partial [Ignavibacteriae bacterium]|nr:TonB-dependent receptor [Ignavibacteriota bacterium]